MEVNHGGLRSLPVRPVPEGGVAYHRQSRRGESQLRQGLHSARHGPWHGAENWRGIAWLLGEASIGEGQQLEIVARNAGGLSRLRRSSDIARLHVGSRSDASDRRR